MKGWTQMFIPVEVNTLTLKTEGVNIDRGNVEGCELHFWRAEALPLGSISSLSSEMTPPSGFLCSVSQDRFGFCSLQ